MEGPSSSAQVAQRRWMLENNVTDTTMDNIFKYDREEQQMIRNVKPWEKDPHYFKEVKISSLSLLKMVMHARSGGNIEIMGLMQGRVDANTLIVIDSFALPVEGTETRVNAQAQAYEFMTNYSEGCEPVGRMEKVVGWYHSHPGYGCWLSGIDVNTQALNQQFQEPFVAIVIDPIRTISAGKVDIGAFRTYPKGYKPPDEPPSEYQTIPLNKIEDFGVHCKSYYSLDITYFKSSLDSKIFDALWNTYWVNTLCSNRLVTNADYITSQLNDLGAKLEQIGNKNSAQFKERLHKAIRDSEKVGCEVLHGLMVQAVKNSLFSSCSLVQIKEQLAAAEPIEAVVDLPELSTSNTPPQPPAQQADTAAMELPKLEQKVEQEMDMAIVPNSTTETNGKGGEGSSTTAAPVDPGSSNGPSEKAAGTSSISVAPADSSSSEGGGGGKNADDTPMEL